MHSKNNYLAMGTLILSLVLILVTVGCTSNELPPDPDYIIGDAVDTMSSLAPMGSEKAHYMVIYDKTVHRIHWFDLQKMEHVNSAPVENPDEAHYVLADVQGNYAIDMTKKGFSLFRADGPAIHNPIKLQGKPRSAAFRPSQGLLVMYDDLSSVGILKLTVEGAIQNKILLGSELASGASIAAGDITDEGKLVLALSDNSIAIVDIDQTLTTKQWVFTRFTTTLSDISWVAPIPGQASQVLVRSRSALSLIDLNVQNILSQQNISGSVAKISKSRDPHVIVKSGEKSTINYVSGGTIKTKDLYRQGDNILASFLDITKDTWYVVDFNKITGTIFNNIDEVDDGREFKQYHLTGMLALETKKVPAKAKIQLADDFIFALFPSELGYAVRYNIQSDQISELKYFNVKHIQP